MKKILSFILVAIMLVTMSFAFAACDDEEQGGSEQTGDGKVKYTVTVVDENGNPIKGATITFSPEGSMDIPFETEAEGVVSYKTAKTVTAKLTEIPTGYKSAQLNKEISFDANGNATVTLTKMPDYIVKVVDQDGNPVAGVSLQMCDKFCVSFPKTDANGQTSTGYQAGNFHVVITGLPDGYSVDNISEEYDFVGNELTIEITKLG